MKQTKIIRKQIEVYLELEKACKLVEPIIATGKKITKRETDKANTLLKEKLGTLEKYPDVARVSCYLSKDYGFNRLRFFAQDRSIQDGEYTVYVGTDSKDIYLDRETCSIDLEGYRSHLKTDIDDRSEAQIEQDIAEYERLEGEIAKLKAKQGEIPFYYLIKQA